MNLVILYRCGAGGEFLTWVLGQQQGFVTQKIMITPGNKWCLTNPAIKLFDATGEFDTKPGAVNLCRFHANWLEDLNTDTLRLSREHIHTWKDTVFLVLWPTTEESNQWQNELALQKVPERPASGTTLESKHLRYHLAGQRYLLVDPYQLFHDYQTAQHTATWIDQQLDTNCDVDTMYSLFSAWRHMNNLTN